MESEPSAGSVRVPEETRRGAWDSPRSGLYITAKEVTVIPSSPTVLEPRNNSAGMEPNAADFEDPFAFDATKLSQDDLHLRLSVAFCLAILISDMPNFPFSRATLHTAVSSSFPTATRLGCAALSPSNRP